MVRGPVKAFGPDGGIRRQRFSLDDAAFLESKKLVFARRNTRGTITSIWFYGDSVFPHQPTLRAGTRYSTEEQIGGCTKAWKHKRKARSSRDIYLAVITSTLIQPKAVAA